MGWALSLSPIGCAIWARLTLLVMTGFDNWAQQVTGLQFQFGWEGDSYWLMKICFKSANYLYFRNSYTTCRIQIWWWQNQLVGSIFVWACLAYEMLRFSMQKTWQCLWMRLLSDKLIWRRLFIFREYNNTQRLVGLSELYSNYPKTEECVFASDGFLK